MSEKQTQTVRKTVARTLLGSLVVFLTVPTGIGPVVGGWFASRGTHRQRRRIVASAVAGMLGVLPWTTIMLLAMKGAIEQIGYHKGIVHVGVLTASPDAFVLWQEVSVSAVLTVTVVAFAVAGGVVTGLLGEEIRSCCGKPSW